ncbi:hypothetical protein ACEPT7_05280 [Burkholderia ubonensis]|uniref:hypothetical protein n=1 Tax=Burkholderia ubonensis TaxID=101571 RepID=UPI0018E12E75|nr:hypothetical protein [Burkholderia ubonensis]
MLMNHTCVWERARSTRRSRTPNVSADVRQARAALGERGAHRRAARHPHSTRLASGNSNGLPAPGGYGYARNAHSNHAMPRRHAIRITIARASGRLAPSIPIQASFSSAFAARRRPFIGLFDTISLAHEQMEEI